MVIKSNVLLSCVVCVHARASEGAESLVWSSIRHMIKTWKMFLWLSCGWLSVELRSHKNNNKSTVGVLDVQTNSAVNDYINMHTWNHVIRRNQVRAKKKKKKDQGICMHGNKTSQSIFLSELVKCDSAAWRFSVRPFPQHSEGNVMTVNAALSQRPWVWLSQTAACSGVGLDIVDFSLSFNWILGVILNPMINDRLFSPHPALLP